MSKFTCHTFVRTESRKGTYLSLLQMAAKQRLRTDRPLLMLTPSCRLSALNSALAALDSEPARSTREILLSAVSPVSGSL